MNRTDFLNMIEDRAPVNRQMIGEISELINIYPYFQSAHLLLLKGLQENDDVKFQNQLRISAIHIADREVLYYLLKTKPSTDAETGESREDNASSENLVYDTQQTVIESAKNSEQLIDEIEKTSGERQSEEQTDTNHDVPVHPILISTESDY